MKKINLLVVLFIFLAAIFTLKDLFLPGFYTSHDGPHQIVRFYYYDLSLRQGQIPPRYVLGLNYGFGYPLFIFSYHLPWLLGMPFSLLGLSVIGSVKMVFLSGFILSGLTMYFYQKRKFGQLPAFAGTFLYLYAPYRFSNIFVRAAAGDATAFIFAPLVFWSFDNILRRKKVSLTACIFLGVSLSALLLSHAMVFFFFSLIFALYVIYRLIFSAKKFRILASCFISLLLFVTLSAFYLLPSFIERGYTRFHQVMQPAFTGQTFVDLSRLLYGRWGYGAVDAQEGAMSLQIGIAQLLAFVLSPAVLLWIYYKKPTAYKRLLKQGFILFVLFLVTVLLMLDISRPFWNFVMRYVVIDFTWRVLSVTVFTASLLAGWCVYALKISLLPSKKIFAGLIPAALAAFFILLAIYGNRNHLRINQSLSWTVDFFLKLEKTTNSFDEYNPQWVHTSLIHENAEAAVFEGPVTWKFRTNSQSGYESEVTAQDSGKLTLNTLYYPGWQVQVDGKNTEIDYQGNGLINFPLEKGDHIVSLRFKRTPLRLFADILTLSSIIFIAVLFLRKKYD